MIALFDPRGIPTSDYKQRYPELGRIDEYRPLSSNELVFVWWFANPTSPLMKKPLSEEERAMEALHRSGLHKHLSEDKQHKYLAIRFPETVHAAVQRTLKFNLDIRQQANDLLIGIFENYKELRDKNKFKDNEGNLDYGAYVTSSSKAAAALPGLVKQIEEGYGITYTDGEDEVDNASSLLRTYVDNTRSSQ